MRRRGVSLACLVSLLSVVPSGCAPRRDRGFGAESPWQVPLAPPGADVAPDAIPHAPGRYYRAETFHEDALAGPHEHGLVQLLGVPLLVIRDADVFRTPPDRAEEIARALQEALHVGDRFFVAGHEAGLPAIYSVSHHGGYPRRVLRVTRGDAVAYARRSGRAVDPRLLAEWWLALLRDVFGVVFLNEPPRGTAPADALGALSALRAQLWAGGRTEQMSTDRLVAAAAAWDPDLRRALRRLAFTVPLGFSGLPEAEPGTPAERDARLPGTPGADWTRAAAP